MFPDALHTTRLTARPITPADAEPIFDGYAKDPEVTRYLTWTPHCSLADTEAYIARCIAAQTSRTFVLAGRNDGLLRGALDLRRPDPHRFSFGYALAQRWWGRGLMAEALAEAARWALDQPGVWRIGSTCDVDNHASARVMEKAGFQREGILRRWMVLPGFGDAPRDSIVYARTR